jgi:hypothetical protein
MAPQKISIFGKKVAYIFGGRQEPIKESQRDFVFLKAVIKKRLRDPGCQQTER